MKLSYYPFTEVPYLSKRDTAFQTEAHQFRAFLGLPFELNSFKKKIEERKRFPIDRDLLTDVLHSQYKAAGIQDPPSSKINLLKDDNTFTVITAHQPSLLTGPLYFIYKIISVINLAERLTEAFPEFNVLPVFIIGSEDHDFEEVNHFKIFNKKIEWNEESQGPVGRMKTESLLPILDQVYEILGNSENAQKMVEIISASFEEVEHYNDAVFRMVHELFKKYDLITLVTDDKRLKTKFIPSIKEEIFEQRSKPIVEEAQSKLEQIGFKSQAFARPINFFYLQDGRRDRIEKEGDHYIVRDTQLKFSKDELELEIDSNPENFSPNVIMRPIYQEIILPNLAYLGGGGEIAYWTERKKQFEAFNISFPILIRRNSVMWITKGDAKNLEKYKIDANRLFEHEDSWVRDYVKENASAELDFKAEYDQFNAAYESLAAKAQMIDASLSKSIKANQVKQFKAFEQLSSRLVRTEKEKHERDINKIRKLHAKLFPGGGLQERKDNFLELYLKYGDEFFDVLKESLDPFNQAFVVISDEA